ncbi:MAG: BON domain-containing protein, partial [Candidatus Binataceae bacterium]
SQGAQTGPRVTAPVQDQSFPDEPPPEQTSGSRRFWGIAGYTVAAIIALIVGVWLALHFTARPANERVAAVSAAPSPAAIASPAAAAMSGPVVSLASTIPLQVSGPAAGASERSHDAIVKAFDDNKAKLLDVYNHELESGGTPDDGMVVHVLIGADGKIAGSSIKTSTTPNPALDAAVLDSVMNWALPPSSAGSAEADLPVIFAHDSSTAAATASALSDKLASLSPSEPPEYALAPEASPSAAPTSAAMAGAMAPAAPPAIAPPASRPAAVERHHRHRHTRVASAPRPHPMPSLLDRVQDRLRADRNLRRVRAYTGPGGVVTLYGKVFDDKTKSYAIRSVRAMTGVNGVVDNVTTDTEQWRREQNQIAQQLASAGLGQVNVKVIGDSAYLDGEVKNAPDKDRAVAIVQSAAAVKVRGNLIRVLPGSVFGF